MIKKLTFILFVFPLFFVLTGTDSKKEKPQSETKNLSERLLVSGTENAIRYIQARIKRNPYDHLNYTKLGESYIQKGRETGDSVYYNKAQKALEEAVELDPDYYAAYVYLGQVSSYRHEFRKTLDYAKRAIELRPNESSPYGILGDAYLEIGEYDIAEKAYEEMLSIDPSFYSYSRMSHAKELSGDVKGAIEDMQKALEGSISENLPKENIAWAEVIIGSLYFNKGDLKEAEEHYNSALNISKDYYIALEHLAEINAVKGNYEESIKLYEKALKINPKPEFHVALGGIYEKIGNQDKANELFNIANDTFEEYIKKGNYAYLRETALFYAENEIDLDRALEIAKKELELKKDIFAYDTLAWVLYKQAKFDKALEAAEETLKLGTKDAKLFYHIGMIYHKLNDEGRAKEYLNLALSTNPYLDIAAAEESKELLNKIDIKQ